MHTELQRGCLNRTKTFGFIVGTCSLLLSPVSAEIPTVLSDVIRKGSGIIDLFADVTSSELQQYLQDGTMQLGVDLNEDASGNESSSSVGVAIKEMELVIKTSNGDLSFSEFYTNTSAIIQEEGSSGGQTFYTLFGSAGSSEITGSTTGFNLSDFDDVIEINNIQITGEIIGAQLNVTFLDTANTGENESFFDYSAGFEEFAILTSQDAALLDSADIGLGEDAPSTVTYSHSPTSAPAATPEPSWFYLLALPALYLWKRRCHEKIDS